MRAAKKAPGRTDRSSTMRLVRSSISECLGPTPTQRQPFQANLRRNMGSFALIHRLSRFGRSFEPLLAILVNRGKQRSTATTWLIRMVRHHRQTGLSQASLDPPAPPSYPRPSALRNVTSQEVFASSAQHSDPPEGCEGQHDDQCNWQETSWGLGLPSAPPGNNRFSRPEFNGEHPNRRPGPRGTSGRW